MRAPLRSPAILALLLHSGLAAQQAAAPLPGRWAVGLSIGTFSFTGASRGPETGEEVSFTPYRPMMLGLSLARGGNRLRVALSARYGESALAIRGLPVSDGDDVTSGVMLVAENAYHLGSFGLNASTRMLRLRGGPVLRPSIGVMLERWTAPGTPVRTIPGAQTGLSAEVALTGAFVAAVEGEFGFTPGSPFRRQELPQEFRPRSTWRRSLAAAVYWRF